MPETAAETAAPRNFAEETALMDRTVDATNIVLDFWWVWLAALVVVGLAFWISGAVKQIGSLSARCKSAFADIDALLAERHALIPNLVEVTKAHAKQEIDVLDRVLETHLAALDAMGEQRMQAETNVGHALNQLINVAGSMPQLSSSKDFIALKQELTRIEEKVTAARRFYNLTVEEYDSARSAMLHGQIAWLFDSPNHERFDLGERRAAMAEPQRVSFG